jgi:hypothetical protein
MTATFQTDLLETGYNGWANYETWNVSLWLQNDEGLYDLAKNFTDYNDIVSVLYEEFGVTETKDGVKFNDSKINRIEMNEMLQDF